jgi:hypothetical protein
MLYFLFRFISLYSLTATLRRCRNSFLVGGVFTTCVIQIPLRFQTVNGMSPWQAGIRLIPFSAVFPFGAGLASALAGKRRMPAIYLLFAGSVLQIVSLVFMARLSLEKLNWGGQYGLQVVAGLGAGFGVGMITLIVPFVIEKRDLGTYPALHSRLHTGAYTLTCHGTLLLLLTPLPIHFLPRKLILFFSSRRHCSGCTGPSSRRSSGLSSCHGGHEQLAAAHAPINCFAS